MSYYNHQRPVIDHLKETMKAIRAFPSDGREESLRNASDFLKIITTTVDEDDRLAAVAHKVTDGFGVAVNLMFTEPFAQIEIGFNLKRKEVTIEWGTRTGRLVHSVDYKSNDLETLKQGWKDSLAMVMGNTYWLDAMRVAVTDETFETLHVDEREQVIAGLRALNKTLDETGFVIAGGVQWDAYGWIISLVNPERGIDMQNPFKIELTAFRGAHSAILENPNEDEKAQHFTDYVFGQYAKYQARRKEKAEEWEQFKAYQDKVNPYKATAAEPLKSARNPNDPDAFLHDLTRIAKEIREGAVEAGEEWDDTTLKMARGQVMVNIGVEADNAGMDVDEKGDSQLTSTGHIKVADYLDNVVKHITEQNNMRDSMLGSIKTSMASFGITDIKWVDDKGVVVDSLDLNTIPTPAETSSAEAPSDKTPKDSKVYPAGYDPEYGFVGPVNTDILKAYLTSDEAPFGFEGSTDWKRVKKWGKKDNIHRVFTGKLSDGEVVKALVSSGDDSDMASISADEVDDTVYYGFWPKEYLDDESVIRLWFSGKAYHERNDGMTDQHCGHALSVYNGLPDYYYETMENCFELHGVSKTKEQISNELDVLGFIFAEGFGEDIGKTPVNNGH